MRYQKLLGSLNTELAKWADRVTEVACGIPLSVKGGEKMRRIYNSFVIAFSMFSKIPMPRCDWSREHMNYAMCFLPWIGAVMGGLLYGWYQLAGLLHLSDAPRSP